MRRGIVDVSSIIWTALYAGKDTEHGYKVVDSDGKEHHVNSAEWGYQNAMNMLVTFMKDVYLRPNQLILVTEGKNTKEARRSLLPTYKAGRDHLPEAYEEFNKAKAMILEQFLAVGSHQAWQDGIESDDVIAFIARNLEGHRFIFSGDKDLAQLCGPGPKDRLRPYGGGVDTTKGRGLDDSAWTGYIHHYRQGQLDKNPFGPFPHNLIPVAIALVGDSVDRIPGAIGFGKGAFEKLLVTFGPEGIELMDRLIRRRELLRLQEDVAEMRELRKIIDSAESVYTSYRLGQLWSERVDTVDAPLRWQAGVVRPASEKTDALLRKFAGRVEIMHRDNYTATVQAVRKYIETSPFVALDIETSTPPESDEWIESRGKDVEATVDVFGSELTSLQVTFGPNLQYTLYLPVDNREEEDIRNLSIDQVREFCELIPKETRIYVHNCSFELPVLYNTWGEKWKDDPDWHGFLPNVVDTKIGASYVDENMRQGLKSLSLHYLDYKQNTFEETVTREYPLSDWQLMPFSRYGLRGKEVARWRVPVPTGKFEDKVDIVESVNEDGEIVMTRVTTHGGGPEIMDLESGPEMVRIIHKMNELTAREVLAYGADDTICTAALANHFRIRMELENTWHVYLEVEQFPAYVTAKGFVDGADFSLERMREMEAEDDKAYAEAWATLRAFLIDIGYEGTSPPVATEVNPAAVKAAYAALVGEPLTTLLKRNDKLAKFLEQTADGIEDEEIADRVRLLSHVVMAGDVDALNALVARYFSGEPTLKLTSPKQMTHLLYDVLCLPVRIINDVTDKQKEANPDLDVAVRLFKKRRAGGDVILTDEHLKLIRQKAKADDTAIDTALAFDTSILDDKARRALRALGTMKSVITRRSLFYKTYWTVKHWKDGKIHAQCNQCAAATRRYSMSDPNLQQLPKKGEGVKFRTCFLPHKKNAVVCSIDFSGQELRLAAERSQDPNLLSCYVGDNLRDVHSLTAAYAMKLKWGPEAVQGYFDAYGKDLVGAADAEYQLFRRLHALGKGHPDGKKADDLRKESKNVNFAAQFGASAPKIAETLIMSLEDAELFLSARAEMFPLVDRAAERAAETCAETGYAMTLMGARRHLRAGITSMEDGVAARAERQAWNAEIQASAAEMSKLAMARLWKSGALHRFDVRFIAPIHDELVTSVVAEHALEFIKIKHECMTAKYSTMSVPILGSISIGPDFGNQIECGDWYIEENIKAALDKIFRREAVAA